MRDPELVVRLQGRQEDRVNLKSYSIDSSFMTATDGFEFALWEEDRSRLYGLETEPVELILDGASQVLGRIDVTEMGGDGSAVTCRGRDYIADLTECNVDPTVKLKQGMTLAAALKLVFAPVGVTTVVDDADVAIRDVRTGVSVKGKAKPTFQALQLEDLKPNPGEGCFEFASRLVARHGCTIQPGTTRSEIVLTAPDYAQDPLYELRRTDDVNASGGNTILSATVTRDYSKFPTYVAFDAKHTTGGDKPKALRQDYDTIALAKSIGGELGENVGRYSVTGRRLPTDTTALTGGKLYRLLYFKDDASRNKAQLTRAAMRALSERLKDTLEYRVTVRGFSDPTSGALWAVNTIVRISDAVLGVNEPLWIESRRFAFSPTAGATTELTCWRLNSFVL